MKQLNVSVRFRSKVSNRLLSNNATDEKVTIIYCTVLYLPYFVFPINKTFKQVCIGSTIIIES